jgi:hypothetical protein
MKTATDKAIDFLQRVLAAGARPVREIEREAREAGLLSATAEIGQCKPFRAARKKLGITPHKIGMQGGWSWSLPTQNAVSDKKASAPKAPSGPGDAVAERGTFESREATSSDAQHPYGPALAELRLKCPEFVEHAWWQEAITDGENFLAERGASAHEFGWTARDLFALPSVPWHPALSYQNDDRGLIWFLRGRQVGAMSAREAYIQNGTGYTVYYKLGL